jgi:hypothetical protein
LLFVLAAGVLTAPAPPAWACSCAAIDHLTFADVAFVGVVVSVDPGPDGLNQVRFAVESVQKGAVGAEATLDVNSGAGASCGLDFVVGRRYRVYGAHGRTDLCSGNQELAGFAVPPGRVTFAPAAEPRPGVYDGSSRPSARLWPYGVGLLVLAGGGVLLRRRRKPQ